MHFNSKAASFAPLSRKIPADLLYCRLNSFTSHTTSHTLFSRMKNYEQAYIGADIILNSSVGRIRHIVIQAGANILRILPLPTSSRSLQVDWINRWRSFTIAHSHLSCSKCSSVRLCDKWKFMKETDRRLSLKNGDMSWSIDHKKKIQCSSERYRSSTYIYLYCKYCLLPTSHKLSRIVEEFGLLLFFACAKCNCSQLAHTSLLIFLLQFVSLFILFLSQLHLNKKKQIKQDQKLFSPISQEKSLSSDITKNSLQSYWYLICI